LGIRIRFEIIGKIWRIGDEIRFGEFVAVFGFGLSCWFGFDKFYKPLPENLS
jgi:hypothetical protein